MILSQLRRQLAGPWARLRPHAGTLLLLPLAALLLPGQFDLPLPALPARGIIRLQGDANDSYLVEARAGQEWTEVWRGRPLDDRRGLATRVSPVLDLPAGAALRVRPVGGDSSYAVGWFSPTPVISFSLLPVAGLPCQPAAPNTPAAPAAEAAP